MKLLVTGAKGFIGKNLCLTLRTLAKSNNRTIDQSNNSPIPQSNNSPLPPLELFECDLDTPREQLERWLDECNFVFHLAGVNRPKDPSEFKTGNTVFTEDLLEKIESRWRWRKEIVPVLLASSTQAALDNDYGRSKKAAEDAVFAYGERTGAPVYVYRFANVFGKWCRPNYNSAVATWCYNIAHDLPIQVRDPNATITLIYIDDLINALLEKLAHHSTFSTYSLLSKNQDILSISPSYTRTLGEITELIQSFHDEPVTLQVPDQADEFAKKLYATYLSYLPEDKFSYPLTMHCDARGSFTEILHTLERGQVSVNISKPGITKGQHWHHTKHEKFCVVSGKGLIQFRKVESREGRVESRAEVINYHVSGEKIEVVRIPPGYTHNIINEGDTDMVTVTWANEVFDPNRPDTFREEV